MATPKIIVGSDASHIRHWIAHLWVKTAKKEIAAKGFFTLALSGGKTPVQLYQNMVNFKNENIWQKTHVFLADERFVDVTHPDSNCGMLDQALFQPLGIPDKNIHPIFSSGEDSKTTAIQYEKHIKEFFVISENLVPQFDFILLGIGEDGHTASLFPDTDKLFEKERLTVVSRSPVLPHERISLSLPVLQNVKKGVFLVTGSRKSDIVKSVVDGESSLPAVLVMSKNSEVFLCLDREAASQLSQNICSEV